MYNGEFPNKSKLLRSHVKRRRKNLLLNKSYDLYGCYTKAHDIIKEMINKYLVKCKMKDFLLTKNLFKHESKNRA